jgi:hypothetical protein
MYFVSTYENRRMKPVEMGRGEDSKRWRGGI